MIEPKIISETKVVFGPCRLSYVHVFEKHSFDGKTEGKYMTNILIPKKEKGTVAALQQAIDAAAKTFIQTKCGGKKPSKGLALPLMDGDEKEEECYEGCYYLNAKCSTRPGLVDRDRSPIVDEEELYSGVWCICSVTFYGYDVSGNKGIACGLNNLMKFKDDERLGGRASAENDFTDVNLYDDDDL